MLLVLTRAACCSEVGGAARDAWRHEVNAGGQGRPQSGGPKLGALNGGAQGVLGGVPCHQGRVGQGGSTGGGTEHGRVACTRAEHVTPAQEAPSQDKLRAVLARAEENIKGTSDG
jgi:hypothetical protein